MLSKPEQNLIKIYEKAIRENWALEAVTDYGTSNTLTYAQLAENIAKMHIIFRQAGLQEGDKVVVDHSWDKYMGKSEVDVYVCCDELRCWVGSCRATKEAVDEIVGPKNILESIRESASEYEYDLLESVLWSRDNSYWYNNKLHVAIEEDEEDYWDEEEE